MSKVGVMKQMYLLYRAFEDYLEDIGPWGEYDLDALAASYRSFCQREPIGGTFLKSALEELLTRLGTESSSNTS
jgi:hypothetical protein